MKDNKSSKNTASNINSIRVLAGFVIMLPVISLGLMVEKVEGNILIPILIMTAVLLIVALTALIAQWRHMKLSLRTMLPKLYYSPFTYMAIFIGASVFGRLIAEELANRSRQAVGLPAYHLGMNDEFSLTVLSILICAVNGVYVIVATIGYFAAHSRSTKAAWFHSAVIIALLSILYANNTIYEYIVKAPVNGYPGFTF